MRAECPSGWDSGAGWGEAGGGGAVCRRGMRRGAASRPFRAADLVRALAAPNTRATVYVDVDSAGYLVVGGAGGGAGGAVLCVSAALAPNVSARNALLSPVTPDCASWPHSTDTLLQLRLESALAPHAALRVWLHESLRAALGVPHLAPHNIRGEEEYACDRCSARFPEPNPLKAHMFLGCAAPAPRRFWRALAERLPPRPAPAPAPAGLPCDPARLEALAAACGGGAHACVYCGKLYSRKYGLKIHIRTHTGYRPLRCRHCARAFGDPSNLNKHLRLHEAPRAGTALRCPRCGKALARRRDLQRHLRTHADSEPPGSGCPE